MGKRKTARKPVAKKKEFLDKTFDCPCCNESKSTYYTVLKEDKTGVIRCRVCQAQFSTNVHKLTAAVDVYGEWVDSIHEQQTRALEARRMAQYGIEAVPDQQEALSDDEDLFGEDEGAYSDDQREQFKNQDDIHQRKEVEDLFEEDEFEEDNNELIKRKDPLPLDEFEEDYYSQPEDYLEDEVVQNPKKHRSSQKFIISDEDEDDEEY